jgi:cytochrome P450
MTETSADPLASWGSYDRDNPFELFASVLKGGPVHPVTLADGHAAYLILGYDVARAALNDVRFSKDMQAAMARSSQVVAPGLPGPDFARHMLAVDPPHHTRLRKLVSGAFTPRRIERLRPRVHAIVDDLLDQIAAAGSPSRCRLPSSANFSVWPRPTDPRWERG